MTLNQLIDSIQELGDKHNIIQKTFRGSILDFLSTENLYPGFCFDMTNAAINGAELSVSFEFWFLDRVAQDQTNEMDVLSDQLQIAQDIIAQMRYPGWEYEIADNIPITFFVEETGDVLAGVRCDVTVNLGYISDRCAVPSTETYP